MTEKQARNDPRVLAGTHRPARNASSGGWTVRDREKFRATRARYNASEKGRATRARYMASEKGRAALARYEASEKGREKRRAKQARRNASEKGRAKRARYKASERGRISNILCSMRRNNKLADARDAALLQTLKGDRQ